MASTYTSNSGIQKPGSGEQAGAWGATVNTNFDILDRITGGVGNITLAGTTHTLTTTDGQLQLWPPLCCALVDNDVIKNGSRTRVREHRKKRRNGKDRER